MKRQIVQSIRTEKKFIFPSGSDVLALNCYRIRKLLLTAAVSLAALSILTANAAEKSEELIDCEDLSMWTGKVLLNREIRRTGVFSFETFGKYPTETIVKDFIPVNPNNTYTLSCFMRSQNADKPASGYLGLRMYDKDKKAINHCNVGVYPDTQNELATAANSGDRHLLVKQNPNWLKIKQAKIAFNAPADYSDLPSFDLSAQVAEITPDGDRLKVTLKSPLKQAYPAGTAVRLHSPWSAPLYGIAKGWMPTEWKEFKTVLNGESEHGTPRDKFWRGTKYVKPFIWFGNWDKKPEEGARLLVDDIRFTVQSAD